MKLFGGLLPNHLYPFLGYSHRLTAKVGEHTFVEFCDVIVAVIEEFCHNPYKMFFFIEDVMEVEELE